MAVSLSAAIDLIEEFSLRCWARKNYVPANKRIATWHPIIQAEMQCRDQELILVKRLDDRDPQRSRAQEFVPLIPQVTHYVHPGQTSINEPHVFSAGRSVWDGYALAVYAGSEGYAFWSA